MKNIFALVFFLVVMARLFGSDLDFSAMRRTMLYYPVLWTLDISQDALFEIEPGTRVISVERFSPSVRRTENGTFLFTGGFMYNGSTYFIDVADLIPANTVDTFDPALISDLNSSDRRTLVPSWYVAVLQSLDRDTVLSMERFWREYDSWWMITTRQDMVQ